MLKHHAVWRVFVLVLSLALLVGCSGEEPAAEPTTIPEPIAADEPTAVPEPSATPEPTSEPTEEPQPEETEEPTAESGSRISDPVEFGEGVFFRDDFTEGLFESWKWVNEDPSRWQITADGWLELTADDPPFAAETPEIPQVNVLTHSLPAGLDVSVHARLRVDPDENFEQGAIFLVEDGDSYITVNLGFCGFCGGRGIYLEAYQDGSSMLEGLQFTPVDVAITDLWLGLDYSPENAVAVAYYAVEEGNWQPIGSPVRNVPAYTMMAVGASNLPGPESNPDEDLIAQFDWVQILQYE